MPREFGGVRNTRCEPKRSSASEKSLRILFENDGIDIFCQSRLSSQGSATPPMTAPRRLASLNHRIRAANGVRRRSRCSSISDGQSIGAAPIVRGRPRLLHPVARCRRDQSMTSERRVPGTSPQTIPCEVLRAGALRRLAIPPSTLVPSPSSFAGSWLSILNANRRSRRSSARSRSRCSSPAFRKARRRGSGGTPRRCRSRRRWRRSGNAARGTCRCGRRS
jgi:hypothetical protein